MKALEMRNVSVVRNGKRILDSINLSIEQDESVAIIGKNGSGKTTLIKLLRGEIHPYFDEDSPPEMKIFGEKNWNIFDIRGRMGIISMDLQNQFGEDTLVRDMIASGFFGSIDIFRNMTVSDEMIASIRNSAVMMGVDDLLERTIEGLSMGEMRRVLIARALVTNPGTLVMDEPMTGLDITMASKFRMMFDIIIEAGVSLIIVTHDLADIPKSIGRVVLMKDGKVYADGSKDELLTSDNMSRLYDEPIKVECNDGSYHMRL
ncbi:MAG: ATP-binding cassette domain-containing protein [Candidatus Methanoplasma sp.]|jgi:iron complex transport system ATP-binding protein|nr:ATP-binding cassette domain-containing protein [Candidatus Methanoplasma sp.]